MSVVQKGQRRISLPAGECRQIQLPMGIRGPRRAGGPSHCHTAPSATAGAVNLSQQQGIGREARRSTHEDPDVLCDSSVHIPLQRTRYSPHLCLESSREVCCTRQDGIPPDRRGRVRGASRSQPQPSLFGPKTCACILPRGCKQQRICLRWRRRRRPGLDPWVGKIPWRRKWQPTPVFLPGESHGQRSLAGRSPWGSHRV